MNTPQTNSEQPHNEINARLRAAVDSVDVPPFLEARIRQQIRNLAVEPLPRRWWTVSAVAAAALTVGLGIAYQLGHLRLTVGVQESYIASISTHIATLMRVGLGDHLHCAVFRKFPSQAPAVEEMETKLGPEFKDLIPVVRQFVPGDYKLVLGHGCRYQGRKFIHLSLKGDSRLLSVVITAKKDGESFQIEGILPELVQSGIPVYSTGVQRFQIAAMESRDHLVYFISDLPGTQNMELMRAMVPALKQILEKAQG
jgi:hypothetical protein